MDLQLLSQVFLATLDADAATRKAAEHHLKELKLTLEVLSGCLSISIDKQLGNYPGIQQSAVVYLKNIINKRWALPSSPQPPPQHTAALELTPEQRAEFRQQVLFALQVASPEVLNHLMAIVSALVSADLPHAWPELVPATTAMFQSPDPNTVYCGVLCCAEILKFFSLSSKGAAAAAAGSIEQKRNNLNSVVSTFFPLLYRTAVPLAVESDEKAGLILWKILKSYKYSIELEMPEYLLREDQLNQWLPLWISVLQRPVQLDTAQHGGENPAFRFTHKPSPSTSSINSSASNLGLLAEAAPITLTSELAVAVWLRCKKWACSIHTKLMTVFATKSSSHSVLKSAVTNDAFPAAYLTHFAPSLCTVFLNEVQVWKQRSPQAVSFLSLNQNLINVYEYFEATIQVDSLWQHVILPNMGPILSELVFETFLLSEDDIELLHNQPEEYILTNVENVEFTPRQNASKFFRKVIKTHGDQVLPGFFEFINQVMAKHHETRHDFELCRQKDAALQMVSAVRSTLLKSGSPFAQQQQMENFMIQQVSLDTTSQHSFLRARACELVAKFGKLAYSMADLEVLFNLTTGCLNDSEVVVRFQAIMALQTLIKYPVVHPWLSGQVSRVMHQIMEMYKDVDSEQISLVMEDLIDIFAEELSPFSVQLSEQLSGQFIRIMGEIFARDQTLNEYGYMDDKNMAALGILNTISTLLFSLESFPELVAKTEVNLLPVFKVIIENSQEAFYQEVFELIDKCLSCTLQVTPTMEKVLGMLQVGFKQNPDHAVEYFIPCLCSFFRYSTTAKLMTEENVKFFFDIPLFYASDKSVHEHDKQQALSFAQVTIVQCSELGPNNYIDYYVSQLLQYCVNDLPGEYSPAVYRRALNTFIAALFYNPQGVTLFLRERNSFDILFTALMQHQELFGRPYEKKLATLSLLRLLATQFPLDPMDPLVPLVFQTAPAYALSYQSQVENETLKETTGGGAGAGMGAPIQFSFVDVTATAAADDPFQAYDPTDFQSTFVDEDQVALTEPLVDKLLEPYDIRSIFEETMRQLRRENEACYVALCEKLPPNVTASQLRSLF